MESNRSSPDVVDRYTIGDNDQFVFESLGKNIRLPERYKFIKPIGSGGGGLVMLADDLKTGELVAIKKVMCPFGGPEMAKRCLREIYLLRTIKHPNIISLIDSFLSGSNPDLYFVMRYIPMDLRKRLVDQVALPIELARAFAYQLLKALSYMHQRGVVHRDLKPENLLIDQSDQLTICDLGLARPADLHMTGYVSTRFYRAPEIMLSWKNYSESVDVWSAGCIISEMLTGHVLFPGVDHVHHINLILQLLGTPSEAILDKICGEKTKSYLLMLPKSEGLDFRTSLFDSPLIPDEAVDLMQRMLVIDPTERMTAAQALNHRFFDPVRDDEATPKNGSMDVEQPIQLESTGGLDGLSLEELRRRVEAEVVLFNSTD